MDGSGGAARHLGPPRTVDVRQFAAARASEVQGLYNALKAQAEANSGESSLTTPRHLRRRTASHNRRLPFRWKRNAAQSGKKKMKKEEDEKAGSSLPRTNVAPSASEEEPSRKRKKPEKKMPSRRVRRRIELQKLRDGTSCCMRDGTRRLATHVWHAKRFSMTKTWGYFLPQGLPGRGRGSKAVFKWVKEAAVLHDASYTDLIELRGPEDALLRVLSQTLETSPGDPKSGLRAKEEEMHGFLYGNAVLHDGGNASREIIAPVTFLWRPSSSSEGKGTSEECSTAADDTRGERQLWIWVHPSAFDSALLALSTACERQGMDDRQASVQCRSRRGELARLDIMGTRALQLLQKVLRPVPRKLVHSSSMEIAALSGDQELNPDMATTTSPEVTEPLSSRIFAKADSLPSGAVLALEVYDPRDTPRSFYSASFSESGPDGVKTLDETVLEDRKRMVDLMEDAGATRWENLVENRLIKEVSDSPYLWSPQAGTKVAALSQKAFSEKRRKRRKAYFTDVDAEFLHSDLEAGGAPDNHRVEQGGACPVLLLKRAHSRPSASGWSIVMPITWVHAFWVPLVFAGGHVIGLRERHWLATDAGLPYFPHDFPDCLAHAGHLEVEHAAYKKKNQARPPSKRSPCFTVSPLQRSVLDAYRDRMLDCSGRPSAVPSELINEEHNEQVLEEKCTTLEDGFRLTDQDGDTAMAEAGSLIAQALSSKLKTPPEEHSAHEVALSSDTAPSSGLASQGVEGAVLPQCTDLVADSETAPSSVVAFQGGEGAVLHEVTDVEGDTEAAPFSVAASQGVEGAVLPEFTDLEGDTEMAGAVTKVTDSFTLPAACPAIDRVSTPERVVPLGCNNAASEVDALQDRVPCLPEQRVDGAVVPEFANQDGHTGITGIGSVVTSSAEPPGPSQTLDEEMGVAELTKPVDGNEVSGVETLPDRVPPLSDDSRGVDGAVVPQFSEQLGGFPIMAGFDTGVPPLSDASRGVHGALVPQFSEPLDCVPAMAGFDTRVPPFSDDSRCVDGAVVPQFSEQLDEVPAIAGFDTTVPQPPSLEMTSETGEGLSVQQPRKPLFGDVETRSSPKASQLQQPEFDGHVSETGSVGGKASTAEEVVVTLPTESHTLEEPEIVGNVTDLGSFHPVKTASGCLPIPLPSSPGNHTPEGLVSNTKPTKARWAFPVFVARTVDALTQAFKEDGLELALLLSPRLMGYGGVRNGLRKGTLEWRPSLSKSVESGIFTTGSSGMDAGVGGHVKGCYVRVLIRVPRRGVLKENGVLCSPTKDDFDGFLSRSQDWQGIEASWLSPKANDGKKRNGAKKGKGKRKKSGKTANPPALQHDNQGEGFAEGTSPLDVECTESCMRASIGCITSTGPQGCSWAGVGVCEVRSLMKLRAMQWQDQRWWNKKEILLLAGNKLSPILRPVLVSLVLETGPEQDIVC